MKLYLSYKSFDLATNLTKTEKKKLFLQYYWAAFKTFWPYLGAIVVIVSSAFMNNIIPLETGLLKSLIIGITCGFLYFQIHCQGVSFLIKKNS